MEDWGGGHTLQPHSLGTEDKCPTPTFRFVVLDWEGAQKCFILRDQTTGDLKSHHLQARVTLTALSVPPQPHFLSADLTYISYLSQLCITVYTRNIIYIMREKSWLFLRALTASSGGGGGGGGGGGHVPPRPPLRSGTGLSIILQLCILMRIIINFIQSHSISILPST